MALLTSAKELESLIPEPNEEYYMSRITYAPRTEVNEKPIFAFAVSRASGEITQIFRVNFVLFSASESNYLFISNAAKDLTARTYYISAKIRGNEKLSKDKWKFETDEIGLHVVVDNVSKDIIYFGSTYLDAQTIRTCLKNRKKVVNETVVAEVVYV